MIGSSARRSGIALAAAAAFALIPATDASAQSSTTRGLLVGAHLGAATFNPENDDRSNAGGAGIRVGYGVNRSLTLFIQADAAAFDVETQDDDLTGTWSMAHADLGLRYHFANSLRRWVPYLQGSLSARAVNLTDIPEGSAFAGEEVSFTGGAVTLGGGVMFYTSQSFAVDLGLLFSGGKFTDVTVGNTTQTDLVDLDAQTTRINLGVSWWP